MSHCEEHTIKSNFTICYVIRINPEQTNSNSIVCLDIYVYLMYIYIFFVALM